MIENRKPNLPLHKIGAVASLSGVPTPTLRVWEARYATFAPHKTPGQHRLYTDEDVLKATLLKRLTEQGHSISRIARLSTQALNSLLQQQQTSDLSRARKDLQSDSVSLAVVGLTLAGRIESQKFTLGFDAPVIRVTAIFDSLQDALASTFAQQPQVLLIKINSLHAGIEVDVDQLARSCQALHVMVFYNFGQEKTIGAMKRSGVLVRREPVSDSDLSDLIKSVLLVNAEKTASQPASGTLIPPRKYSDSVLMRVAGISTNVLCECPRNVAEIIVQLASFEQYSHECLNKSSEDAHLHAYLSSVSGSARALFERALEMVAQHEGIALHEDPHEKLNPEAL